MYLSGQMMVKNEEFWIWYSIMSVVNEVDELVVWDTGSTDNTPDIIKSFSNPKIKFRQVRASSNAEITQIRQNMLESTAADWILLVDADEIWPRVGLLEIAEFLRLSGPAKAGIHRNWNLVGDIFHYLPDAYGRYHIGGQTGNLTIRLLKNSRDLKITGKFPLETYQYGPTSIQSIPPSQLHVFKTKYFHTSFLPRTFTPTRLFSAKLDISLAMSSPMILLTRKRFTLHIRH